MSAMSASGVAEIVPHCGTCDADTEHYPDIGVWACPFCGNVSPSHYNTDRGPILADEDPVTDVIVVRGLLSSKAGLKAVLDTPYRAKEDLLDLPQKTSRRWNPDLDSWTVMAHSRGLAASHLEEAGWPVIDLVELRRARGDPE